MYSLIASLSIDIHDRLIFSLILDIHAPYKKVSKYKLRFKLKPWITLALQEPISIKNSLLKKFINCNDSQTKEQLHTR